MTDYSKMSDFEINKAVAEELYKDRLSLFVCRDAPSRPAVTVFADLGDGELVSIACADHCNNPADAWPIIVANLIEVSPDYDFTDESEQELCATGFWTANHVEADGTSYYQSHHNPLRAAMIVFLMMKEQG